jgi:hypothetical protein
MSRIESIFGTILSEVVGNFMPAEPDHGVDDPLGIGLFHEIELGQRIRVVGGSDDRRLAIDGPDGR